MPLFLLRKKRIYITFNSYITEMHETTDFCSAGKETYFLSDSSRPVGLKCSPQNTSNAAS